LQLGARSGDYYEVLAGLNEGDQVVISANFLVDSESSMKAALESLLTGASSGGTAAGHSGH
jgi:Cu(I)/Ag(I) efflux system membrane fusion protein